MDKTTLLGLIFGTACIIVPMFLGGKPSAYWDLKSILITIGGAVSSTLTSYRPAEAIQILKVTAKAFRDKGIELEKTVKTLVDLSHKARREGLLSLEAEMENINDEFMRQSIQLVVDGVEPDVIIETMDLELESIEARHKRGQGMYKTLGAMFPAWGMIGTLVGLVVMLKSLDDPDSLGPAMSTALITTFYGSVLANLIALPIANKLAIKSEEELHEKRLIVEGILSIQAGENPRIMEQKLKTFLSPEQKRRYAELTQEYDGREEKTQPNFSSTVG
jgi:chemotaxis protein MotA